MTQTVTDPVARLAALRAELAHLDQREPEAQRTLDRIAQDWPAVQAAVDLARLSTDRDALPLVEDALRKLALEKANAESVLRRAQSRALR